MSLTTVFLVTLNLLVICAVPYMNGLEDATVDSFDCDVVMQNNDGHCASRGSRDGHFTFKFLDYRKTWSLPRDILCLLYGCVDFVLNWWYQIVLEKTSLNPTYCMQYFVFLYMCVPGTHVGTYILLHVFVHVLSYSVHTQL